jgi:hypothetical protein
MKPTKLNFLKFIFLGALFYSSTLLGQAEENDFKGAAQNATNPLAFVTKLQLQPNYSFKDNGGDQLTLITRITQPTKSIGLPLIKSKDLSKLYTMYRLEVPVVSKTVSNPELTTTGLSDLIFVDVIAFKTKIGLLGIGPSLIIPTASSDYLGSGKWNSGLAGVFMTKGFGLTLCVLGQQYVSVGGDSNRADQNYMLFQPIVTKIFKGGYFMSFSPIMKFDWENDAYNIPLGVNFEKAFSKNLSLFLDAEYVVSGLG